MGDLRIALTVYRKFNFICGESMTQDRPEFEDMLAKAPDEVADFANSDNSLVNMLQHRLHETPSLVPLTVLILSIAAFGVLLG